MITKVYIPHLSLTKSAQLGRPRIPSYDLAPAERYGDIIMLTDPEAYYLMFDMPAMFELFRTRLKSFTDIDYIVAIGDPAAIAAATMVASQVNKGRVKLLRWDRKLKEYAEIQLDLTTERKADGPESSRDTGSIENAAAPEKDRSTETDGRGRSSTRH